MDKQIRAITNTQIELVASRVSMLNGCFYWTSGHAEKLRASLEHNNVEGDLSVIADGEGDGGIEDGDILIKIAEVSVSLKEKSFDEIRNVAVEQIGPDKYVDAVAVAAIFNSLDRVANATGIPIEQTKVEMTEGVRKNLGLDQMATAKLPNQKSADDILSQKPDWGPSTHEGL